MKITFHKMHGLGNDFVITESLAHTGILNPEFIQAISNRNTGIGFDQLLDITPINHGQYAVKIFNANGSVAKQCGNGLRCVAYMVLNNEQDNVTLTVFENHYRAISYQDQVEVCMGQPTGLVPNRPYHQPVSINILGKTIWAYLISLGNPHAVVFTDQLVGVDFETHANLISTHPSFPEGVNVSFVIKSDPEHAIVRTYERGAGETMACGSAACAVASAIFAEHRSNTATIQFKGGELSTRSDENGTIYQRGPAKKIFSGELEINEFCAANREQYI